MMGSGQLSNTSDNFSAYLNVIKDKIKQLTCSPEFVGNVVFEVNIKDGEIQNINVGGKQSIKI